MSGPLTGEERVHHSGSDAGLSVRDFWAWSASDLLGNTLRGLLAEFIVAKALRTEHPRQEWDAYDVLTPDGTRVEVKSSAYLQSWKQKGPSQIRFDIARKRWWNAVTNEYAKTPERPSDVYVFCVFTPKTTTKADVLDIAQWEFLLLPTRVLDARVPEQKSIGLSGLLALGARVEAYNDLRQAVKEMSPS